MKSLILILSCFLFAFSAIAQVKINRYAESKISLQGISGKKLLDKEVIIPEINVDAVYKKWEGQKISKFAEPVEVDISPFEQGLWEKVDNYNINRIKITAKNAISIAVYFDQLKLSSNAELYIYNSDGTVITGPVTEKENIETGKLWGSNVFNGTSVIIEFKVPVSEKKSNELHIQKILYGINPKTKLPYSSKDSTTGPGFGLSSSCNINALCTPGWEQERRAIAQVVDEGGGWCSAALIMNTCNTNRPFILTANHCVEQNGNLINTNNSTFEFLWFSPTCTPTTNTSSTLLFNGAAIRARWEQSDFALLELNQSISQNSTLTFLGWSRSSTPPNSSVGIHHPMGDIMKISIENNPASIGSVRNFPNTAWRVVWDQGTVQGGSSGSPLFDMNNHRIIGQLFSNTQPTNFPCNQPTGGTNYGRFDVSWDGGGTSSTRLRDWLDPNNSGAITTNTTDVANLPPQNLSLSITGLSLICSGSSIYTLNGAPMGFPIIWSISNTNIATLTSNGNQATVTKVGNGNVTITATVTSSCLANNTVTKSIVVGVPQASNIPLWSSKTNTTIGNPVGFVAGYPPGNRCQIQSTEWQVSMSASVNTGDFPCEPDNGTSTNIFFQSTGTAYVQARIQNTCGWSDWSAAVPIQVSSGYFFMISPNPATSTITIQQKEKTKGTIDEVRIFDNMSNLKKQYKYGRSTTQTQINVADLKAGIYFIEISSGRNKERQQLIIQK